MSLVEVWRKKRVGGIQFPDQPFTICSPGVNFINILQATFTRVDPKSTKRKSNQAAFGALGICGSKSCAYTFFMKLTPEFGLKAVLHLSLTSHLIGGGLGIGLTLSLAGGGLFSTHTRCGMFLVVPGILAGRGVFISIYYLQQHCPTLSPFATCGDRPFKQEVFSRSCLVVDKPNK